MDPSRFDRIARLFAARRLSRRAALAAGALAATTGLRPATAQDTAEGTPVSGDTLEPAAKVPFLFVQSFQQGSIAPTEGADGTFTLTLELGTGQTVYFSDRPERIVGLEQTPQFLEGLGFSPDNPPNAALVVDDGAGGTNVAVVELFDPLYDSVDGGVTYQIEVLADWQQDLELELSEAPTDLSALPDRFEHAHLFIDGCEDLTICYLPDPDRGPRTVGPLPGAPIDQCWAPFAGCDPANGPCHGLPKSHWAKVCNDIYPGCYGSCVAR